ncbi:MAG: Mrp/NBP35 family ATP-binding protein [Alphaproteobacteria bacterium]
MALPDKPTVLDALKKIAGPDGTANIVEQGLIGADDITLSNGKAIITVKVPAAQAQALEPMRLAVEKAVSAIDGIASALAILTAERQPGTASPANGAGAPALSQSPPMPASTSAAATPAGPDAGIGDVKSVIAVASGKGGVGKSTTAVNLALALQVNGLAVGILDADIYGPSMPRLLNIHGRPKPVAGRILMPLEGYGLKVMSMGFLVDEDTPMIWRGPMVISALTQMLNEVQWGPLDVLVVDMPPGTGDAQLTMAQKVPLAGAVIVSTPQDLALIDARKGLNMFKRTEVPVLGIVENMSAFVCPKCGERTDIFGHGGARDEAARIGVPFLGGIPLDIEIREKSDAGTPIVIAAPDSAIADIYQEIAARISQALGQEKQAAGRQPPKIVIE